MLPSSSKKSVMLIMKKVLPSGATHFAYRSLFVSAVVFPHVVVKSFNLEHNNQSIRERKLKSCSTAVAVQIVFII